ncbi:family 2, facilitated glucose transporter member [Seminavis robusta]|uniref:Hexose transporter 1 n=2 Tax=Seminavis robusta TaxID=568900 RepID=A0A9N8EN52_9STRA|nr:family 2, facilitated glucose transporter member [Seminavis robusta]|eukprot:Sro1504_g278090.1 family 2, facilitated glucose transporter member (653) ;mRNA; r:6813-9275
MPSNEQTRLLSGENAQYYQQGLNDRPNAGSELAKAGRSASIGALGGSSSLGSFHFKSAPNVQGLPKSYSVSADGSPSYLTPTQMGRQELYQQVPFTAVFGLQKRERLVSQAFASYAAELDVKDQKGLSDAEKDSRRSQASLIILDELEFDANVVTTPLVFAIIVAAASQFLVGYNTGVMNAPEKVVFPGHSTGAWSLAVAAFAVGGPFGAFVGGKMADKRGRRGALLIDTWTFLAGGILQTFAWDMYTIIIARFVIGFASGYSSVLVPVYLGELAPPTLRGMLGTLTQFALVTGILVADLLAFPFATERGWRVLFAVTVVVAGVQLICAPFLLESPRWLLGRDPNSLKARYIIKKLRGLRHDHEVETEVGLFVMGGAAQRQEDASTTVVLREMWNHSRLRVLLLSSLMLQAAQQLSGINAVFYYSTAFFDGVIDNPLLGTTIVGAVNVLATYAALLLMDRVGRKTLILWSSGGMLLACVVIVLSLLDYFGHIMALVAVNVYVCFFEIGLGPIPWLIVAEMFEAKYVAVAMSVSSQLNWACNFIIGLIFPYMNNYLGPYSFVPFAVVLLITFIFTWTVLPETQGTTPGELAAEMTRRNSMSVVYEANTDNAGAIDLEWRKAMEQLRQEEEAQMQAGTYDYGFKPIEQQAAPSV